MNKGISIGKYVPYDTPIHRMDARFKILGIICLMVCIFLSFNVGNAFENMYMTLLMLGIVTLIIIILMIVSRIGIKSLFSQLKTLWIMMILVTIINIFAIRDDSLGSFVIHLWSLDWKIYYYSFYQSFYIILRLILMVAITMILTSTTKPLDLTYALEWYMTPLKVIKFPAHEIAMTISIALRFIPTLLDETERIMKAQSSRGVDFEHGRLKEKLRAIISLIIPLFLSAFQRSEELANAMEARGYDPSAKRTRYRIMKWHVRDTIGLIVCNLIMAGFITVSAMHLNLISLIGGLFL